MIKFLKNSVFIGLFINSFLVFSVYAEEKVRIENFQYYSQVKNKSLSGDINSVYLSEDFLNKSQNDFKDIRVFDNNNKETPFIILNDYIPEDKKEIFSLDILDYSQSNNKDAVIVKVEGKHLPNIGKIILETDNRDFNKKITISGSSDKNNWTYLTRDNIYDFSSKINLRKDFIQLKSPAKFKYYKFEIEKISQKDKDILLKLNYKGLDLSFNENENQPFRINFLSVETFSKNKEIKLLDIKEINPQITEQNKKSLINIENTLPLEKIEFNISNPYYYREVNIYSGSKNSPIITKDFIYDLGNSTDSEKKSIVINSLNSKNLRIEIENYDNPPLSIKSITTSRIKKNLFFVSSGKDCNIYTGNKDINNPIYDIASYINQTNWYKNKYNKISLSSIIDNKSFKATFSNEDRDKIQKNVLMVLVFSIVVILGFWIYKMMKDVKVKSE